MTAETHPSSLKKPPALIKVVADMHIPFLRNVLEPRCQVVYLPGQQIRKEDLVGADALLTRTRTRCDAGLLEGTAVSFVGSATIGTDHIDTEYCARQGIAWANAPGCNSSSVMQYMAAAIASLWKNYRFKPSQLTLGVIGAGNVGSKVEKLGRILGMRVLVNDPPRERKEGHGGFVSLKTLLSQSDLVSLHVPLTRSGKDKTWHMAGEEFLQAMKEQAILFNTSRGEVIDTNDLKTALGKGRIKAAILDVWENEPLIDRELLEMAELATPHIAGYSVEGKANGTRMIIHALSRVFGLGLESWQPEKLPQPVQPETFRLPVQGDETGLLMDSILYTYPVTEDDRNLRAAPQDFEKHRSAYPVRREFPFFTLEKTGCSPRSKEKLEMLGFNVNV